MEVEVRTKKVQVKVHLGMGFWALIASLLR